MRQDFSRATPCSTGARVADSARLTVCWVGVSSRRVHQGAQRGCPPRPARGPDHIGRDLPLIHRRQAAVRPPGRTGPGSAWSPTTPLSTSPGSPTRPRKPSSAHWQAALSPTASTSCAPSTGPAVLPLRNGRSPRPVISRAGYRWGFRAGGLADRAVLIFPRRITGSINDHCPFVKSLGYGLRSLTPRPQQTAARGPGFQLTVGGMVAAGGWCCCRARGCRAAALQPFVRWPQGCARLPVIPSRRRATWSSAMCGGRGQSKPRPRRAGGRHVPDRPPDRVRGAHTVWRARTRISPSRGP